MAEEGTGQLGLETELAGAEVKSVTEKRVGKLTHKALLEKISILEKERKSNFGKLSKVKQSILKFMGDKEHVNKVENELTVFNELCNTIQQVHASLLGLLPAEEASKHEIWYQAKMLNVKEFLVGTNQWLSDTAACPATKVGDDHDDEVNDDLLGQIEQSQTVQSENEIGPQDSISNVQSRHHGSNRSSSSRFSTSEKGLDLSSPLSIHRPQYMWLHPHSSVNLYHNNAMLKLNRFSIFVHAFCITTTANCQSWLSTASLAINANIQSKLSTHSRPTSAATPARPKSDSRSLQSAATTE